ncbi:MAG: hypothetical protein F6K24_15430, partial [Okeania sp. SIO2D1]|nr:hypothetical protein [Okeania sp. SIO2D1]
MQNQINSRPNSHQSISLISCLYKAFCLLSEARKQRKYNKKTLKFVLNKWKNISEDNEIPVIAKRLQMEMFLVEWGWIIIGILVIIGGTLAINIVIFNEKEKPVVISPLPTNTKSLREKIPDCIKENNCIFIIDIANVEDIISPNFSKLTVKFTAGVTPDDKISIRNHGINSGQIGIDGNDIIYSGTIIGNFTGGEGTTPLEVTFNRNTTRKIAEVVVRNIVYQNVSENPTFGSRTVEFKIADGYNAISEPFTTNINVIPTQKDITLNVPTAQTVKENANLAISSISINGSENQKITITLLVSNGQLTVKPDVVDGLTTEEISNNKTNKVTLTGTVAEVNTTLANSAGIIYQGNQNFSGEDSLIITMSINNLVKGLVWPPNALIVEPISKSVSITVNPLNPPPVINVPSDRQIAKQNRDLPITDINISDPNNQNISVILETVNGKLTVKTNVSQGLPEENIKNNQTQKVTLTGNISLINNIFAAPSGVTYRGEKIGQDSLKVTV